MTESKEKIIRRILRKMIGKDHSVVESKAGLLIEILYNAEYTCFLDFICENETGAIHTIYLSMYKENNEYIYITEGGD